MTTLKNKIKVISPLPSKLKNKISFQKIILISIGLITLTFIIYIAYIRLIPYINAVKIDKIAGKKISYTDCNILDYVIINKDKSYTMQLTNNECQTHNYEGDIIIKNNEIYFKYKEIIIKNNKKTTINKTIKGIINIQKDYNIKINNNIFESDANE